MANFDTIKTAIDANIKTNGTQDITGGKMNSILKQIVDATGEQLTELESEVGLKTQDSEKVFSISDEKGADILQIKKGGELQTKAFDSKNVPFSKNDTEFDFAIADEKGNVIFAIKDGHVISQKFNSSTLNAKIVQKITETTNDLNAKIDSYREKNGLLYSKFFSLSTLIAEFNVDGVNNKLTSDGLFVSSDGGKIVLDKFFSLSNRVVEYLCRFNSDSVAVFTTDQTPPFTTIDMKNKKFSILNGSEIDEVGLDADIDDHLFKLQITKEYQKQTARLIDINANKVYEVSKVQDGEGGAGAGSLNDNPTIIGMQSDKYAFYAAKGSFLLKNIRVFAKVNHVKLLMYGDSITEPEAYYPSKDFMSSWTQLVMAQVNGASVSSGRSGTTIDEIITRISNELPYINAKYVMVTIGTNGGNTIDKLTKLVDYIIACGAIPILNSIPCNDNNGTSNALDNNAMIEAVRANKGIKGCRFDIATSVNGDGKTLDYSMMYQEQYSDGTWYHHPNPKGAEAMFLRTFIDIPEIYN